MRWYEEKIKQLKDQLPVYSVCGDDCGVCPRYVAETEEELHETAVFWMQASWRDHVMTNEETRCKGCGTRSTCSFMLLPCTKNHGVDACRECPEFICDKIRDMLSRSAIKQEGCRKACASEEEYQMFCRAFYEKEKNLGVEF